MPTPILVIGALGNVGVEVVKQLLVKDDKQFAERILMRKRSRKDLASSVDAFVLILQTQQLTRRLSRVLKNMFFWRPLHITNIKRDMVPSIDAAKSAGVKHVVFLSLIGIENTKYVPHYKVETYLKEVNLQTTFLRCSFFMQNLNTTHCKEIKERNEIFVPVGNAKTSFIDARDIGAVAAVALTQEGHANKNYDLTGSEALDYWEATKY